MNNRNALVKLVRERVKLDRILIVDDEKDACEYIQRALAHYGYENTQTAADADDALEILRTGDIALALLDIRMPGHDGLWLLRQLSELGGDTIAVVISASNEFDDVKEAFHDGAEGYISKPVDMDQLNIEVTKALEKRYLMLANLEYQKKLESMLWDRKGEQS